MVAAYELNDEAVERRARRADVVVVWCAGWTSLVAAGLGFGELHAWVTNRAWSFDMSHATVIGVFVCAASGL